MAPRLIPREGIFTADFALSIFQSTALNPAILYAKFHRAPG